MPDYSNTIRNLRATLARQEEKIIVTENQLRYFLQQQVEWELSLEPTPTTDTKTQ